VDLFLIRHAEAVPVGDQGVIEDADRPLTESGHAQARALAGGFRRARVHLDRVLTSPLLRARQTAEDMLSQWDKVNAPDLTLCDELAPGGKRRKLNRFLRSLTGSTFALVGHQPDLNLYAAWLIGSKKTQIDVAKAGVAYITCGDRPGKGRGCLVWLMPPEWFTDGPGGS
jgi:phosphohistidine phosphatase